MADKELVYLSISGEKYHKRGVLGTGSSKCGLGTLAYWPGIPVSDIPGKYLCKKCFPQGVNPNMARDTTSKAQEH